MHTTGTLDAADQRADVDIEGPVLAKHKVSGVAVTWDAEHIFFLPASTGMQSKASECKEKMIGFFSHEKYL